MSDLFRKFLNGVSASSCLSEIYGEPAKNVTSYLSEIGISGRQAVFIP